MKTGVVTDMCKRWITPWILFLVLAIPRAGMYIILDVIYIIKYVLAITIIIKML